jgi:DNA-binding response OmpR family regulator
MVLVIDDEAHVREVIQDSLTFVGIEAIGAENGSAGLALFQARQTEIDVIILDLTMPGLDGRETLRRLRELTSTMPVILSSGIGEADLAHLTRNDPSVLHLAKPFTLDTLVAIVRRARGLAGGN